MSNGRASPAWILIGMIAALAVLATGPAIAQEPQEPQGTEPLEILGAGGTVVIPLLGDDPAFGAVNVSVSLEPLVAPELVTGEILFANGGIYPAVALNLSDLSGDRVKLGLAMIPGDVAAVIKYRISSAPEPLALASGEAPAASPTMDISIGLDGEGVCLGAFYNVPLE